MPLLVVAPRVREARPPRRMARHYGFLGLLALTVGACGGVPKSASQPSSRGAAPHVVDPCQNAVPALTELEAIRQAHATQDSLAAMLRAERKVVQTGKIRRSRDPSSDRLFAEAEQDAERRVRAIQRYAATVEQAQLGTSEAVSHLEWRCRFERALLSSKKKPPKDAALKRMECERFAQMSAALRWDDASSVTMLANAVETLKTLPPDSVHACADRARALASALRSVNEDKAMFRAPRAPIPSDEKLAKCHAGPELPPLVVAGEPNARPLTVVVSAKPPKGLGPHFERIAREATSEDAQVYRNVAAGRYGSGFIVVVGRAADRETFVVTNRHVADLASSLEVKLDGGATFDAVPAFVDATYDIAVLVPKDDARKIAPRGGLSLSRGPAVDGEDVVAMGYPGLLGEPSFQLTKGHISNANVAFPDVGKLAHLQHTAAIDPGSSGGPLLNARGEVLGINTFKLEGREAVGIAVPAEAIAHAITAARAGRECDAQCKRGAMEDACLALVTELARAEPNATAVQRMLGEDIVAEHGITSHNVMVDRDASIHTRFRTSPVATLSEAVARRLIADVQDAGGIHPIETCSDTRRTRTSVDDDSASISISLMDGPRTLAFGWDHSRFRLKDFQFDSEESEESEPPPPPKKKSPAKKAAKK